MKDKGQAWIYAIFIIFLIIGVFFFTGEYLDTKRENKSLHEALIDYESRYVTMANGGTELFRMLQECRNEVSNG